MTLATPTADKRDICEDARIAVEQRRAILGPSLAAMGFSEHGAPPSELPEPLLCQGLEVPLESWERNVLLGRTAGDTATLLAHFAEGIAFRALCGGRLHRLKTELPDPKQLDATRAEMVEETAVGMALQQEVQRDIDRLVSKGEMGDAKKLTGFRRKIDQALAELEQRLGAQAKEQAQARSASLVTPRGSGSESRKRVSQAVSQPVERGMTLEDLYALEQKLTRERSERAPEPLPEPTPEELFEAGLRQQEEDAVQPATCEVAEKPRGIDPAKRLQRLLGLLAIFVVAYAVFLVVNRAPAPPPRLGMAYFEHLEAVAQVKPRPPSLFVRLKEAKWAGLPTEEKLRLVEELGRIAGEQGYHGVHVRTSSGAIVGEWLAKGGARLIARPETAS